MITKEKIIEALKNVYDPELKRSLIELNMIKDIIIEKRDVKI